MKALGLNAGFEAAVGHFVFEVFRFREQLSGAVDEELLRPDDQNLMQPFLFKLAERHAVFFQEPDEVFARDAAVLAAGDAVTPEPARIEPLAHRPRRDLADLRDLAGGENFFHGRHSSKEF